MSLSRGASVALAGLAGGGRVLLSLHAVYTLGLWAASHASPRPPAEPAAADPKIAVLVVAHDEARVIGSCVESLASQRYPADRFDVFVVADACSDETASLARDAGARVFERTGAAGGKPRAVAYGVERITETGSYDAIALFDADNVVDPNFLASAARRIAQGESVVQGFVDAKNRDASWVAAASAIGFWIIDGLVQLPRERLGLSAQLMGTGFVARPELYAEALAPAGALSDDIEANARLALRGVRVAYEPSARTLDEKPTTMRASLRQRLRWMQGRWASVETWLPSLLAAAIVPNNRATLERWRSLDAAIQLVSPSLVFSASLLGTLAIVGRTRRALGLAALFFLVPVPVVLRHRPSAKIWAVYLTQPAYVLFSVPLALYGFVRRKDSVWVHTPHGSPD